MSQLFIIVFGVLMTTSGPAIAYFGPGAGITMLGALWAVIAAIFLTVGSLLFWPIRSYFRRRKKSAPIQEDKSVANHSDEEANQER
jgi:hypothetical protein